MDFKILKNAVAKQFESMKQFMLFRTNTDKDELWNTYLSSFPEGTNNIFKTRREYDCTCCKQYIRAIGNVVAIVNNKLVSIWDVELSDPNFQIVANALSAEVKSKAIGDYFLHFEKNAGTEKTFSDAINGVVAWNHFHTILPQQYVMKNSDIASTLGESRSIRDVLYRSLTEIDMESINTVLELISQGSLYRGEEHKTSVEKFKKLKNDFSKLPDDQKELYVWSIAKSSPVSVSKIKNTVIGTLLSDLSEGKDMEQAVASFEAKVAPTNYKRPTALVTKAMVKKAQETIEKLGLTSALSRRYASIDDITINNILFADRPTTKKLTKSVFDEIQTKQTVNTKSLARVEEVSIEKFISDILPKAESLEVFLDNTYNNNFVSLIAPDDLNSKNLFKWNNKFSWSYNGEVADSIKEKVKAAGGSITGDLCCRLAWYNHDDLDFHMVELPKTKSQYEIYFASRGVASPSGGRLDVDMNAGYGYSRTPVENIFYNSVKTMKPGKYKLFVHNFNKREMKDFGFDVEIDLLGTQYNFSYPDSVKQSESIVVAEFEYSVESGLKLLNSLPSTKVSKTVWNLDSQNFHKVNVVMMSPNYWDDFKTGNKHYFFMLEKCYNESVARGFYNEFLKDELTPHRKVIEMVGSKMKTEKSELQLSGLGFSSTQRNSLLCKVSGTFNRTIKIIF